MSFIIFDTEYTTWKGCQENGWRDSQKREIVQIAALKVSDQLDVVSEFNALCKPIINPVLSDYFIGLTHITNEQVQKQGLPFSSVYKKFEAFVGNDVCFSHAWGADETHESDGVIVKENLALNGLTEAKKIIYKNIAPIFSELYKQNGINIQNQSSGQIVKLLGIENTMKRLNLDTHNAFYDTYSILEGLKYFAPKSIELIKQRKEKCNGL